MELASALQNWIPVHVKKSSSDLLCEWLFLGDKEFTEPFFDDTIAACKHANENNRRFKVFSTIDSLVDWAGAMDAITPSAFIFHVSRCGSTLLSQLLSCDKKHLVLSEVPLLDEILRLPFQHNSFDSESTQEYLNAAMAFYGRRRTKFQQHLFVKTDSWHVHFYEQLRDLFPHIPFFFLYRNPVDVLMSQQRQRGIQSVPGMIEPAVFGFRCAESNETNLDRYMSRVLASYFRKMKSIASVDSHSFFFDYAEGINNIVKQVYSILGLSLDDEMMATIENRCRYHAKHPNLLFEEKTKALQVPDYLEPALSLYEEIKLIGRKKA